MSFSVAEICVIPVVDTMSVWVSFMPLTSEACATADRSNRPDHWDSLTLDWSAVGQL